MKRENHFSLLVFSIFIALLFSANAWCADTGQVKKKKAGVSLPEDFNKCYAFVNKANYVEALQCFTELSQKNCGDAEVFFCIGISNFHLKQYPSAITAYKQAILIKPNSEYIYWGLGDTYLQTGQYNEAIAAYKQVLRIKPDLAEVQYYLGNAYAKNAQYNEAIVAFKQAVRLNPDLAFAHYNLGYYYSETGQYNEAIDPLKQAVRVKPDFADAYHLLGFAYMKTGQNKEAIVAFNQAVRLNPTNNSARTLSQALQTIRDGMSSAEMNTEIARSERRAKEIDSRIQQMQHQEIIDALERRDNRW